MVGGKIGGDRRLCDRFWYYSSGNIRSVPLNPHPIQIGGGIRSTQTIERYDQAGIDRFIIGTRALSDPNWVADTTNKARHEQVAEVTRTLKQLAKRYKCPIITASQLNDDGRARESRAISHDADVMLKINDESDGITIEKNRNGQRGYNLQLALNGENQRFQ